MNRANRYGRAAEGATVSSMTAAQVILARADVSYAHGLLFRIHMKGDFGETLAQRCFLRNKLGEQISGRWTSLTPRVGRQGFDHLFVRQRGGKFTWMVCESKYGSSQLGMTKGGVQQMSWVWLHDRAAKLGDSYLKLADHAVGFRKQPWFRGGIRSYEVPLKGGEKATFWQDSKGKLYYDGPVDKLSEARATAKKMGNDLKSPDCNIRPRRFHITVEGRNVRITLEDLKVAKGGKTVDGSTLRGDIVLKDVLGKKISDEELRKAIAEKLRDKFPGLNDKEVRELSEEIASSKTNGSLLKNAMSIAGRVVLQAGVAVGVAGLFDLALQFGFTRKIDVRRLILSCGSAAAGATIGQTMSIILVKTNGGACVVRVLQKVFRLRSASLMRNAIGGGVGSVATTGIMAYGSVLFGHGNWEEANQEFASGVAGTAGGAIITTGITSAVAMWGTAGTGTAISTLSGAAQTNAILAWLGMGGGKMLGGVVLGGIGVLSAFVISIGVSLAFSQYKAATNRKFQLLKGDAYSRSDVWEAVAKRMLRA